jgi:hypothetical protein
MAYVFTPPTRTERLPLRSATNGLFKRMSWQVGVTVLKEGGFYRQVIEPTPEEIEAADAAYPGRAQLHDHHRERDALVAAGYGSYITGAP